MAILLLLSVFTHLWNPIGFPALHVDEGHYMLKTLYILEGLVFNHKTAMRRHSSVSFSSGTFKIIGYPDSVNPVEGDVH
jgi:hypothetical protein